MEDQVKSLHEAVVAGDEAAVQQCLEDVVNSRGFEGRSALHLSARYGNIGITILLLDRNANPNLQDDYGETPLHGVFYKAECDIVALLLDRGADPNLQDITGSTPLHNASFSGKVDVVTLLIERGADPNLQDFTGSTPLHISATKFNSVEAAASLLDHGADGNWQDKYGHTPLHYAAYKGCLEVAQLFINRNLNINIQTDLSMETPLHLAIRKHNNGISKLLMENGADLNLLGFLAVKSFLQSLNYQDCEGLVMTYLIAGGYIPMENVIDFGSYAFIDYIVPEVQTVLMHCCNHYFMLLDHVGWERPVLSDVHTLYYKKANDFWVKNDDSYKPYRDSLIKEVKEMKEKKIGLNTIYDVFAKFQNPTYVRNSQLEQAIKSPESEKEFPRYTSLLRITFAKAKPRKMLLERAMEVLKIPLPIVCRMKILSLLGNSDLENVITSFKKP